MARRKSAEEKKGTLAWLLTFSDLFTLLFTFFVLLLSMCSLETGKIKQVQSATSEAMGVLYEGKREEVEERVMMSSTQQINEAAIKAENFYRKFSGLKMRALDLNMSGSLEFEELERGYSIILRDDIIFNSSNAELKPEAFPVLRIIGDAIRDFGGEVMVEGHTDDLPISTGQFPSNWELSGARAVSVVRYLEEHAGVNPAVLSAVGYADSKPKVSNHAPDSRSKNRRVEIILVPEIIRGR
jgi:chemotaxis protein MotB